MCEDGSGHAPHKLIAGYRKFKQKYYENAPELFRDQLQHGQSPQVAVVACSDSRVDPAIILQVEPGDIFTVRNVAALVPPYEHDGHHHGTSAALEYAVTVLKVPHVVVIGHSHCGGVSAMVQRQETDAEHGEFIEVWTDLLQEARACALHETPELTGESLVRAAEREAVHLSLRNLRTFPFVQKALSNQALHIHGWYLDIVTGEMQAWNEDRQCFENL